jgi:PAS domain-containing protein
MTTSSLPELLAAWRNAERRWEQQAPAEEVHRAALDVVEAFVAYQDAALPAGTREFLLIVDDDQRYVGATAGVTTVLGYRPEELLGRRIGDLAAAEDLEATPAQWLAFMAAGRQDGGFRLQSKAGETVELRYQARAHHPIPGFHLSRLWPEDSQAG